MGSQYWCRLRPGLMAGLAILCAGAIVPAAGASAVEKPPAHGAQPQDPFARGMELFKQGKLETALAAFRQAEAAEPRDAVIQSWVGFVNFKLRRYEEAIRHFTQSIELNGNNPDTYNNLGNARLARGDVDGAIESYRHAVELVQEQPGSHADLYYNLGSALVKRTPPDLDAGLTAFLQAEKEAPEDALTQNNIGCVFERKHRQNPGANPIQLAIERYQRAVDLNPKNPVFYRNLGLAARQLGGQTELVIRSLKKAVELDRKDYASFVALAEEYQNSDLASQAVNAYKAAITIRPAEYLPRYNLGLLYLRLTPPNYAAAITQLQEAVALRPTDQRALSALGFVNYRANRLEDAARWYQRAIQVAPDYQTAWANSAMVMEKLGNREKAVQCARQAIKLDPSDAASRSLLASIYLAKRQYADAAQELAEVVRLDAKDSSACNNLGFALEKLSRMEEAADAYRKAIDANPKMAIAYYNLGALYEKKGMKELAKEHYQKALQAEPGLTDARKSIERLTPN